jgi:hypothetical protein
VQEVLKTFQFSQGSEPLQTAIFRYLRGLHPELELTAEDLATLETEYLVPAELIYRNPHRHPALDQDPAHAVRSALAEAYTVFNVESLPDRLSVVAYLAQKILERDEKFLLEQVGRNYQPNGSPHYNPYTDPWRSDLCYFGFQGKTTGHPDFDQLFADVTDHWRQRLRISSAAHERAVRCVVSEFNSHHGPELRVKLPRSAQGRRDLVGQ